MMKKCTQMMLPSFMAGILFLVAGVSKLFMMTPGGFAEGMLVPTFGIGMGVALVLAWLVIIAEVVGGVALMMRCKFPQMLYKKLVWSLIVIMLVAIIFVHAPAKDIMTILKDLVITAVLFSALPRCAGKKCAGGTCDESKKCEGGTCPAEKAAMAEE